MQSPIEPNNCQSSAGEQEEVFVFPVTVAQHRFWLLDQLHPGNPALNVPLAGKLTGRLDSSLLERAVNEVIRRHEILRTSFRVVAEEVVQVIHPRKSIKLDWYDLSDLVGHAAETELNRLMIQEGERPFVLAEGPLLRGGIIKFSETSHVLMLTMHHIGCDGWSNGILMREVAEAYTGFIEGKALPELALQYADFAHWQKEWLASPAAAEQQQYWASQLSGILPVMNLPTDRPRRAGRSYPGTIETLLLPQDLVASLRAFGNREDLTLFMIFLGVYTILLHRYSGQRDLVIGSPAANRSQTELEGLIGLFSNPLLLRFKIAPKTGIKSFLRQVRDVALGAFAHQNYPFERLIDQVQTDPSRSGLQWLQIYFVFQKAFMLPQEMPALSMSPLRSISPGAMFEWTLGVLERAEGVRLQLEYNTELYARSTIERFLGHFRRTLEVLVAEPEIDLDLIPLLNPPELKQLSDWSPRRVPASGNVRVHELFEEQVAARPHAPAVQWGTSIWSYCQLNARANQLAHLMRGLGAGPGLSVGLALKPCSAEYVTGLLAILKAGASVVPLEKGSAGGGLRDAATALKLMLVLGEPDDRAMIDALEVGFISFQEDEARIEDQSDSNLTNIVLADQPAVVRFTAGRGEPARGLVFSHRALLHEVQVARRECQIQPTDRALLSECGSLAFLAAGACVVIPTGLVGRGAMDPNVWIELIRSEALTVADLPTPAWNELVSLLARERTRDALPALRLFVIGGGVASPAALAAWQQTATSRHVKLVELYTTSEVAGAIAVTERRVTDDSEATMWLSRVTSNSSLQLLDSNLQPVPQGVPGDVYVGGEGLASGYLTGSQIHPLPIIRSSAPGLLAADLVKTDQRARFVDGVGMELIGRMGQLQLTPGFRVELAEIRSFILGHPGVWDVWLVPHASNARYGLTAYVVCKADPPQTSEALKLYLADYFPAYMVPTEVVMLSALPLDSFGRIDEGALPQPTVPARGGESTQARALTSLEKRLCEIWAKVFRRESVGPEENFFDLGGDSIITLQISSRANQVGIRVTPKQIWQCKTVAGLAAVAGISQNGDVDQKTVSGVVPLLPIQRWFFGNQFENPHHWNQSVVLEPCIPMDEDSLEAAFRALVVHHDALRLRFLQEEGGWEQINDPRDSHRYVRRIDLSGLSEPARAEALAASMAEVQGSLDLERGPLLSAAYYQLGKPLPARLLFVVHHLAVDGVSWRVLLEDLQTLLQQSSKQEPLRLPPKTTSYQEWAKKLVDYAQTEAVVAEADFWRSMTPGRPFRLPLDFPDAPNTEAFTQKVVTQFSAEETRVLLQDMPGKLHVQINEVLVYALGRALSEWVGRDQVLFDLEGHGREDIFSAVDLSRTVGWFTTLYPIALKFGARVSCQDELHQVRDTLRGVPAKGLGFGLLQYLRDHGSINHSLDALCGNQVVFNYLGQVDLGRESKALLQRVWENAGPSRSPAGHRAHVLDVNARVAEEKLQIGWTYASRQLRRETVERLASRFATILRELSRQTTFTEGRASTTLSVFPLAPVGPAKLAGLLGRFPDVTDIYPLSPMQQLFHSLLSTNSSVGCEQFQFLLQGDLDPARLKRAWEELAARHPVLRTGFFAEDLEEPIQFVRSRVELPWIDLDWTDVDASERSSRLKLLLEEDRTQGYSLSVPPLLRFHLIRLGQRQWQLIWSFHHLLLDGWSWPLLYSELVAIYDALATASTAQLPAVVEYRSYIQWLQKQDRATAKLYWRNELRGFETPTPLGFAADPSTTAVGTARPELARELSTPETGALVGLARRHEVSLSTLVEAAWALALAHQSALKDVVFGVTVSGRPSSLAGVESIVGMFINNLPRRINILEEEEIGTLLRRIHSKQMETADFEHTSLFQIREWSQVPGRFRLFNSLVLFQNYRKVHSSSADAPHVLRDAKVQAEIVTSYPITLVCSPGDALKLKALYDPAQIRSQGAEYYLDLAVKALRSLSEGKVHRVAELLAGLPPRRADGVDLGADSTRRGSQEPVAPRTPTETKLAQIWERVLGLPSVGVKDNFFDIGGHSLPAVSVFREIQRVWKVNLPLVTLFKAPTIEALAAVIEGRDGGANWKSLVPIKSSGTRPPFYCIHGVGGNILEFADMARYLPDDQPLYGLQAQGLDGRTPRHTSVEQMATHYVKEIREFQPLGPYYLGGSSFGGLVAMEVAQQLSAMGERIGILVLFDTWAPGHPKYPATLPSWRRKLYRWRLRFELHYSNLRLSEGSARREYLTRKAVRLLARWRRQGHQWWTRFLGRLHPRAIRDVRKAGHRALAKYTPRPYVGKITLLRATQQPQGIIDDRTNGWSLMAQSGVDVFDVPGHHGSMMEDPRARVLVEVLTTCLTTAQAEHMPASRACEPITADG